MSHDDIALESLQVLARVFWASITGRDDNVSSSLPTLDGPCPIIDGKTMFYFGFPDTRDTPFDNNDEQQQHHHHPMCQGMDWYILAYLSVGVHVISWGTRWLLWEPAARAIAQRTCHPTFNRETCRKVSMNLTECLFFVLSGVFAFALFADQPWLYQPHTWLQGRDNFHVPAAVKFYYILYAARFVSDFVSLFFEVGRNTTALMVACLHHAVTLGLIAIAIYGNYIRGGAVIMFFFDWADPLLLLAKTFKNMSCHPSDWFQWIANRCFEVFAVVFFLSRVVIYNHVTYHFVVTLHKEAIVERILKTLEVKTIV